MLPGDSDPNDKKSTFGDEKPAKTYLRGSDNKQMSYAWDRLVPLLVPSLQLRGPLRSDFVFFDQISVFYSGSR